MNWPWNKSKETSLENDIFTEKDPDRFPWSPEAPDAEPEAEPEAEPTAPSLDGLGEAERQQVDAYLAARDQAQRERMMAYGLDLAADGQPVIRDPGRFSTWAQPAQRHPTADPPPAPGASLSPPAPAEEEPLVLDPMSMTGEDLSRVIERAVTKAVTPLAQQNQALAAQLQRRQAKDALGSVRAAIEQYYPADAALVDHPDFAESYRRLAEASDPQYLEDPRWIASTAVGLKPWLAEIAPPPFTPAAPRDTQGRFTQVAQTEAARHQASRQTLGQVAPGRAGTSPEPSDTGTLRQIGGFVEAFAQYAPGKIANKRSSAQEIQALEQDDFDNWQRVRRGEAPKARR